MLVELDSPSNWRTCSRSFFTGIKERGQPATSPIVEELNLGHVETGWSIRVRNRMASRTTTDGLFLVYKLISQGITCADVLFAM